MRSDFVREQTKKIGENLRFLRIQRSLTQQKVADVLGVSFQQVQKYESGQNKLPLEKLCALKAFYEVRFEDFFVGVFEHEKDLHENEAEKQEYLIMRLRKAQNQYERNKIYEVLAILLRDL